jgi:hypothetical protein
LKRKHLISVLIVVAFVVFCFYVVFIGDNERENLDNAQKPDIGDGDVVQENDSRTANVGDSAEVSDNREDSAPSEATNSSEKRRMTEKIETAFLELENTDVGDNEYIPRARSLAKLSQKAPEVIVRKLLTGNKETRHRALSVMYCFHSTGADASRLVSLLAEVYKHEELEMQVSILLVFDHVKSVDALPLLREVLDDRTPQPPPPRGVEPPNPPLRMCDFSYGAVLEILGEMGIEHGLTAKYGRATTAQLSKMKSWLDEHPDLFTPSDARGGENKKR